MNLSPCPARVRANLKAFADGELSPLARFSLAHHLRGCPACRKELIQMQTLSNELREGEVEEAPLSSQLRAHILENVPTQHSDEDAVALARRRRVARKKMVLAVGMASVLAVVGISTLSNTTVRETFGKASDSTTTSSDAVPQGGGHDPSVVVGKAERAAGTVSESGSAAGTASEAKNQLFADDHVKARRGENFATDRVEVQRSITDLRQELATSRSVAEAPSNAPQWYTANRSSSVVPQTRAVHREGSLTVAVQNAEQAGNDATAIIKNVGGFVANTSLETGAGQKRTAVLDCRVPVDKFEIVVQKIGQLGSVRAKSLSGQDITAQLAQSGARRRTLSQELSIAQARLAQKEKSSKPKAYDLYQLRSEVRALRMQASQARAALETLQKYGSLSSLYVSLQDGIPVVATPQAAGWTDSLSPTTRAAWNSFLSNARLPLQLLLWVLAYSPLWLPALLIWRKFGRKWLEA